jgi:hypothetical protein
MMTMYNEERTVMTMTKRQAGGVEVDRKCKGRLAA